jgi:DNA-directed RNA polymerase subunit beta'
VQGRVERIDAAPAGGSNVYVSGKKHYVPAANRVLVEVGQTVEKGDALSSGEQNPHDILRLRGVPSVRDHLSSELKKEYHGQGMKLKSNIIESAVRSLTNLTRITDPGDTDYAPGDYAPLSQVEAQIRKGSQIGHTPELKGINQAPLFGNEDWMSQLNFQNLKKTVVNAATKNWSSSIHGTNPVAAWVYGAEFGRGDRPGAY